MRGRLRADQGRSAAERKIRFKDVVTIFKDFKIFVGGFMYFGKAPTDLSIVITNAESPRHQVLSCQPTATRSLRPP